MKRGILLFATLFLLFVGTAVPGMGQERQVKVSDRSTTDQEIVLSALKTAISIIQDITLRYASTPISEQLQLLSGRMSDAADGYGGFRSVDSPLQAVELSEILSEIRRDMRSILRELKRIGEEKLAKELSDTVDEMRRAVRIARELELESTPTRTDRFSEGEHERDRRSDRRRGRITVRDTDDETRLSKRDRNDDPFWKARDIDWHRQTSTFVGEFTARWPFKETALYRPIPAFRYNRVEGLVLGVRRLPLDWSDYERGRVYGQIGYAFSLDDWRYEIGAETKLNHSYRRMNFGLKIGGAYRKNTNTDDLWKSNWAENTLAASLFRYDFFDYYETEGWTAYVVGKLTPFVQFGVGYRDDDYRSLQNETTWSLFGGDPFRFNPSIQNGQMRTVVASLEGGRIRGYNYLPFGFAFRFEAEFGKGMGGDFSFNRYVGDLRSYARMSRHAGLSLRLRGGYTEGNVPVQKAFTLGGVGSVRAYSQNALFGTRMLLANVEYTLYRPGFFDDLFDDMAFFGLFDAGWTNSGGVNEFKSDDVFSAAGFGISLDDRNIRLEIAWPLQDLGMGTDPSVWLRLNPTF
ncbi:MAG: hypothetical protein BMS9Abin05_0577 [Rhodothermia bacterium]|nr:MAG: hypothetical protein BMS9Abin05_0577 [Rhodothermia bacterium]